MHEKTFKNRCDEIRFEIKVLGDEVRRFMNSLGFNKEEAYKGQHSEMRANIMLAYRHLEDARMRIGKILQAADDGVSILDK